LRTLALAYAITTHKAQGSQFRRVVIPIAQSRLFDRTVPYTTMTRAQEQVVFVGDRSAFEAAIVAPPHVSRRCTGLGKSSFASGGVTHRELWRENSHALNVGIVCAGATFITPRAIES
jgi:hypothetical protein